MPGANAEEPERRSKMSFDVSLTPFYQPSADINGGGTFKQSSVLLRMRTRRVISPGTTAGISLSYDVDDYDFSGTSILGGAQPWDKVNRFGLRFPLFTRLRNNWSIGVTPFLEWFQERGADRNDSLSYGVTTFALNTIERGKSLGVGVALSRAIDDDIDVFPFIAVDWRFNEHWRIANPFEAGALGPAGLELIYSFNNRWHLGGGGV